MRNTSNDLIISWFDAVLSWHQTYVIPMCELHVENLCSFWQPFNTSMQSIKNSISNILLLLSNIANILSATIKHHAIDCKHIMRKFGYCIYAKIYEYEPKRNCESMHEILFVTIFKVEPVANLTKVAWRTETATFSLNSFQHMPCNLSKSDMRLHDSSWLPNKGVYMRLELLVCGPGDCIIIVPPDHALQWIARAASLWMNPFGWCLSLNKTEFWVLSIVVSGKIILGTRAHCTSSGN